MLVFISHASENKDSYTNLVFALNKAGIQTWDPTQLKPGISLSEQLGKAIKECSICVLLATRLSIKSRWCLAEAGAFWGAGKRVIIYKGEPGLADKDLPPQFAGNLWASNIEVVAKAILEELSAPAKKSASIPITKPVQGKRLFQHKGYYPVDLAPKTNRPILNRETYANAIDYLLDNNIHDQLAAMDLVYLRQDNIVREPDVVLDNHLESYDLLIRKYELDVFISNFEAEKHRVFRNYLRIVDDIGETLKDVFLEILLHDVRNPIHSIIAAKNSKKISGRRLRDPSTRFVYQYVTNQGRDLIAAMEGGSKVAYFKQFTETKKVKASTTPIFDDIYGLVGILCINIDIEAIKNLDTDGQKLFFQNYIWNTGETPAFELSQWGLK